MSSNETSNPTEITTIDDVRNQIADIFKITPDEWPDDKEIDVDVKFMVVPKNITFKVRKK